MEGILSARGRRHSATLAVSYFVVAGCTGYINPPTPAPPAPPSADPAEKACPVLPAMLGSCGDLHLVKAMLTCGPPGTMRVIPVGLPGGGVRVTARLRDNTRLTGEIITPDPGCWLKDGTFMALNVGVTYTGDQGVESATDPTPCVFQSKVDYSQINFDQAIFNPHIPAMRDLIHRQIEQAVVDTLFGAGKGRARCARWRPFQACGDGVVDGTEICDDGNTTPGDGCNSTCTGP